MELQLKKCDRKRVKKNIDPVDPVLKMFDETRNEIKMIFDKAKKRHG